ncbi:hypothetical protein UFOVP839_37 [uncultured Caudovirales phage]|uniref:Uncharacterized protein n=1 Tax=uncultured Caudovirales phage TaxID=2100421 RepID=A0A6J5PB74_9CAUD|nr:hypothetical protein UFOVP839_37 [uncultured Caudovirales phage]CAB4183605.1 hypothetical protein UFOVP1100_32 [uncultured Caudovirales phage]CAB4214405.1 hypothetical protein UFOVP1461_35 [uncultured Caudovirales phage]CAB4219268.1 hypothetical protein UFOVP1612_15 [uncultured Caudovirales phage]
MNKVIDWSVPVLLALAVAGYMINLFQRFPL